MPYNKVKSGYTIQKIEGEEVMPVELTLEETPIDTTEEILKLKKYSVATKALFWETLYKVSKGIKIVDDDKQPIVRVWKMIYGGLDKRTKHKSYVNETLKTFIGLFGIKLDDKVLDGGISFDKDLTNSDNTNINNEFSIDE